MSKTTHFASSTIDAITAILDVAVDTQKTNAVSLYGTTAIAVDIPASLNSSVITFEGSIDGGQNFKPIYQGADIYSIAFNGNEGIYTLDANTFVAFDQIKLLLDTGESSNHNFVIKPYVV